MAAMSYEEPNMDGDDDVHGHYFELEGPNGESVR